MNFVCFCIHVHKIVNTGFSNSEIGGIFDEPESYFSYSYEITGIKNVSYTKLVRIQTSEFNSCDPKLSV